ncbi:MAG: hypothetical protein JXP34_20000 [Planctomycetes bacterium]|nr:hypothetical protein [Planctomycetota bacterium]
MEIDRMALGQGGLSEEPMWDDRIAEVRALRPRLIRLFIQEYFDLLPAPGRYHFDTLDRSVGTILRAGAKPLMCICFKPKMLFPEVDQDIVEPNDYAAWEELIARLVDHYGRRGAGIRYWEVSNEPDIGEDGGCPYRFRPESYVRYYGHTARAILRADPDARVGGPAVANVRSPILPALLAAAQAGEVPLHFVSWHIYSSDPRAIRGTIEHAKALLARHPAVKAETFLDEWNMDLSPEPKDPRFQPAYVAETIRQMKDAGLDTSCYYHIRDYHISRERFAPFMSPRGAAFMEKWWNRRPQVDGLFDYQGTVRPTYFLFKLLSRLTGERLRVTAEDGTVHGLASRDERLGLYNILVWNFSAQPRFANIALTGAPGDLVAWPIVLDPRSGAAGENERLVPGHSLAIERQRPTLEVVLEPYQVRFWALERK